MAVTLESLVLDFQADFSKFDSQLDTASRKAQQKARNLEKNLTIKPKVDLEPLHELNRLLDIKQRHLRETVQYYRNNPIVPRSGSGGATLSLPKSSSGGGVDFSKISSELNRLGDRLIQKLDSLEQEQKRNTQAVKDTETKDLGTIARESFNQAIVGGLGKAATMPFKAVDLKGQFGGLVKGLLLQLGNSVSTQIGVELELESGQSRLSDALQQGVEKGVKQGLSQVKAEVASVFGVTIAETTGEKPKGSQRDRGIQGVAQSNRDFSLARSEYDSIVKKVESAKARVESAAKDSAFKRVQKRIDTLNKANQYLLEKKPSGYEKKIQSNSEKASRLQEAPEFKAVLEQRKQLDSLVKEGNKIAAQATEYRANLEKAQRGLATLSSRQLANAQKKLRGELSTLDAVDRNAVDALKQKATENNLAQEKLNKRLSHERKKLKGINRLQFNLDLEARDLQGQLETPQSRSRLDEIAKQKQKLDRAVETVRQSVREQQKQLQQVIKEGDSTISQLSSPELNQALKQEEAIQNKLAVIQAEQQRRRAEKNPKLLQDVGASIGLNVADVDKLPTFEAFQNETSKIHGAYDSTSNVVGMNPKLYAEIGKDLGEASLKAIETMAHEVSHGMQSGFNEANARAIIAGTKKPKLLNNLAKVTKEEAIALGEKLAAYDKMNLSTNEKLMELDAFLTGMRTKKKALQIKKVRNTDRTTQGVVKATTELQKQALFAIKELRAAGNTSDADLSALLQMVSNIRSTTINKLGQLNNLQRSQGVVDPESFVKDFEEDLKKLALMRAELVKQLVGVSQGEKINPEAVKKTSQNPSQKVKGLAAVISELGVTSDKTASKIRSLIEELTISKPLVDPASNDPWLDDNQSKAVYERNKSLLETIKDLGNSSQTAQRQIQELVDTLMSVSVGERIGYTPEADNDDIPIYDVEVMGQENSIARKALNTFGRSLLDATRTIYKASQTVESFAFAFMPGAGMTKKGLQTVAPLAAIGAAGVAVPGLGGAMVEGLGLVQGVLMPVFQAGGGLLGAGIETAVVNGVNTIGTAIAGEVASTLPMIGGGLSSAVLGALPEVGATLGAGAATVTSGVVVAGGAAASVAVPAVMVSKAVSDGVSQGVRKLTGSSEQSNQQTQLAGQQAAEQLKLAAHAASSFAKRLEIIKTEITPLKELKKLPAGQRKYLGEKDVKALAAASNEANVALTAAKSDSKLSQKIAQQKAQIVKMLNARVKQLKSDGVEVIIDTPSLKETKARRIQQVNTQAEGQNFVDGFTNQVDRGEARAFDAAVDFGKSGIKGLKKGIDSHSPSKETEKEGRNYIAGFINKIKEGAKTVFSTVRLLGVKATSALGIGLETDGDKWTAKTQKRIAELEKHIIRMDRALRGLDELDRSTAESVAAVGVRLSGTGGSPDPRNLVNSQSTSEAGQKVGQASRTAYEGVKQLLNYSGAGYGLQQVGLFFNAFKDGFVGIGKQSRKAKAELAALATGAVLLILGRQILTAARNLGMLALELDRINLKLNAIGQGGSNIFSKFGDSANKAGTSVQQYADTYASMYSSLKGKVVNPDVLVSDLTIGLANRGVVGEGQQRALTALAQMASKGKVSMEELRQQLGEALPGAMTISANAMGVTEAKFMQMVSSGQVVSSQFLPKFAEELNNVAGETKSLNKEVAEFGNLVTEIKAGAVANLPLTQGMSLLNGALGLLKGVLKPVTALVMGLATVAIANLVWQAIQAALAIKAVSTALTTTGTVLSAALPYIAIAVGGFIAINSLMDSFGGNTKAIREVNSELKKLANEGLDKVEKKVSGYKTKNISRFGEGLARLFGRETASQRDLRRFTEGLGANNQVLLDLSIKFKARITPEAIAEVNDDIQQDLTEIDSLSYQINNRQAFNLSREEALDLQRQVDELTDGVEAKIALKFKPAELDAALKEIDKLEKEIAQKREQGAGDAEIGVLESELTRYRREIEAMRNQVKALQTMTSPVMSNLREYRAASNSQQAQLEIAKIERLTESYGQLAEMKAYAGTFAANAMVDNLKGIEAEIASLDNLKRKAQETYGVLNSSQKEDLANMLGTDDFNNLSKEQIENAKQELEARKEAVGSVDPYIEAALEALDGMENLTRREKQLALEKLQAQTEIFNATRDLKNQMKRMVVDNFAKEIEAKKLAKQIQNRGNAGRDDELFNAGSNLRNQERQNAGLIRQQQRAFEDFVRGVQRAAEDMRSATKQIALEVGKMDLSSLSSTISGLNNYAKSAGIQDTLGLSAIRDSVAQAIGITVSDNRPGIKLDISNQRRNFERTQSDQLRQKDELNFTLNNAIAEAKERALQLDKERLDLQDKQGLSQGEMLLKVQQFNLSVQEQNRQIAETNQTAGVYGVTGRVSPLSVPEFDLQAAKEQEGYAQIYLQDINSQMMRSQEDLMQKLGSIRNKGNQDINRTLTDTQDAFKESLSASNQKLKAETRRIEVETKNLAETIRGQFHQIKKNITDGVVDLKKEARQLSLELKDLYAQGGIFSTAYNPVTQFGVELSGKVDDKIDELKKRARTLEEITNLYNGNLSRSNLISEVSNLKGSEIDDELKGVILSEITSATSDAEFKAVLDKYSQATEKTKRYVRQLQSNKGAIVTGGVDRFDRQKEVEKITMDDDLRIKAVDIQSNTPFLSDGQTRKLNLRKEEIRLGKELRSTYEAIDQSVFNGELKANEATKRKIELSKQYQQELENTRKKLSVTYDIGQALQSSIEGAFSSFGENLFKSFSGDAELEKLKASADYADKLRDAQEKYADDPGQLSKVSERLEMLNRAKLDGIKNEFSVFGSIVGTVKNAVLDFAKAMVQMAAKMAAMKLVSSLFGGMFSMGGTVGDVANFSNGGTIGDSISRAMTREGQGAIPIVAHKGEEVLTTRNGDAAFFRAIKKNGTWDMLKNNGTQSFNYGGLVGSNGSTANIVKSSNFRQGNTINMTTNYNVVQKGDNFGRSRSQIEAENSARQRRYYERNK